MKGIELAKKFYEECGKPMLESEFPDLLDKIAIAFVGSGSERYGFDDEISKDHDFEAGFGIFLPDESVVDRRSEFLLERAYYKLPKEFLGVKRGLVSAVGGNRNGPIRTLDFYKSKVGYDNGLSLKDWLTLPDYAFAEATNGEVFFDGYGEFTQIRNYLKNPPEDVIKKRLAGNLLVMAQSGQYNYSRCAMRGEKEASELAVHEFVTACIKAIFLLHGKFAPYYKWSFHALKKLDGEKEIAEKLSFILLENGKDCSLQEKKYDEIESIASIIIDRLIDRGLSKATCGDLEKHAYSVNDGIEDGEIRNLNIFTSV